MFVCMYVCLGCENCMCVCLYWRVQRCWAYNIYVCMYVCMHVMVSQDLKQPQRHAHVPVDRYEFVYVCFVSVYSRSSLSLLC